MTHDATDGLQRAVGRVVRRLREDLDWSQQDLAERCDVHYQTVANIELGRVKSSRSIGRVASALGVRLDELFLEAYEESSVMHPDVGELVRRLLDLNGLDKAELGALMGASAADVERLVRGDAGPLLWGAAAVVFGVPPHIFETAAVEGIEAVTMSNESLRGFMRRGRSRDDRV